MHGWLPAIQVVVDLFAAKFQIKTEDPPAKVPFLRFNNYGADDQFVFERTSASVQQIKAQVNNWYRRMMTVGSQIFDLDQTRNKISSKLA